MFLGEYGGNPVRQQARRERSEEHTSELQSQSNLVCRLLLEKKKIQQHDTVLDHLTIYAPDVFIYRGMPGLDRPLIPHRLLLFGHPHLRHPLTFAVLASRTTP